MSDYNYIGNNSGTIGQFGGRGNTYSAAPEPAEPGVPAGRSELALYSFADVVGYSRLSARLQKLSQGNLVGILDLATGEAGVRPGLVTAQDQGDARLLAFPAGTDVAKVLAVMPRSFNDELTARNRDMAEHARMRVRLAFSMGASIRGEAGLVGAAPVTVVRIANSAVFRQAMRAAPLAQCGVMIDDFLHGECVRQEFRADMDSDDYAPVRVSDPDKGFEAAAWMRLFGYSGQQVRSLLG